VFWGTTNRTDYLKDETGNRRFLPVRVTQVDIEGLKANRDKLWAEAVHYYRAGENYWLEGKLSKYAEQQANERFEEDPWIEVINEKLSSSEEVSLRGAIEECFVGIDAQNITQQMTRRMSVCLQMAGWIRDGRFTTGERRNQARYVRGPEAGPVSHIAPDEFSNHDF
jgi:predicted P-loop ATPase